MFEDVDLTDFLVRQTVVPSAMLVMANKMASTMNAIAMDIHGNVAFVVSQLGSC